MLSIKQIILDVLKPHHPNSLDFSCAIAEKLPGARVELTVMEVDEKTETVELSLNGDRLNYNAVLEAISAMGATVHSIDKVEVENITNDAL